MPIVKNIHECRVNSQSEEDIFQAFREIPEDAEKVSLYGIKLALLSEDVMKALEKILPSKVIQLTLMDFGLSHDQGIEKLKLILKQFSPGKICIDLTWNNLGMYGAGLSSGFSDLSNSVKSLKLGWNNLELLSTLEFITLVASLPATITCISLAGNQMGTKSGTDIALIFSKIKHATSLDVSENDLGGLVEIDLDEAFESLPSQIEYLGLRGNGFGIYSRAFGKELSKLPGNVKTLDLSCNCLHLLSLENFKASARCVQFVTKIILSADEIAKMTLEKRAAFKAIFPSLKEITCSDGKKFFSDNPLFSFFNANEQQPAEVLEENTRTMQM